MTSRTSLVHLFWTGGWDSTFRLLHLLIKKGRMVQPHYLIDADRRSTGEELLARDKIKEKLFACFPETESLLLPTIFFDNTELPDMPDVTESYRRLRLHYWIGSQYEWMAKYCIMRNLCDMEMCVHAGVMAEGLLDPLVIRAQTANDRYYIMDPRYRSTDEYKVFGHYHFPFYDISKEKMGNIAWGYGWQDMMDLTWFCHRPLPNHIPCGRCPPCDLVMRSGMTWRMPLVSKIMYYVSLRPFVKSRFYRTARRVKRLIIPGQLAARTQKTFIL